MSLPPGHRILSVFVSERCGAVGEHSEDPAPPLMLVLVADVLPDRFDVVHTSDAAPDEPSVVRLKECRRGERLQNRLGWTFGHEGLLARFGPAVTPQMRFEHRWWGNSADWSHCGLEFHRHSLLGSIRSTVGPITEQRYHRRVATFECPLAWVRRDEQRLLLTSVHTAVARLRAIVDEALARGDIESSRPLMADLDAVIGERGLDRTRLDLQSLCPEDCLAVDREIKS
jgi:hypothetical protein